MEEREYFEVAVTTHAKTWYKQYFDDSNFPEWTKSNVGITVPLMFPEPKTSSIGEDHETPCIFCEKSWVLPKDQQTFLRHLMESHSFVIEETNLIADLPSYIKYWKNKFSNPKALKEHLFVMKAPVTGPDGKSKKEREFYFLNDTNPEDKELRIQLQMRHLEKVLEIRENERKNTEFNRGCLFCGLTFQGDPNGLFDHMAFSHYFVVGHPDNLVFIEEFLDLLEKKLENMTCIYCENVFKSRHALKDHMRKKSHRKVNPKNVSYDKFYLINYLEFGKTWSEVSKRDEFELLEEDELPTGFESDEENENDWSDWKGDLSGAVCLFCEASYIEMKELMNHMSVIHGFEFNSLKAKHKLSFYQQVKLVNFIRRQVHLMKCINCFEKFNSRDELMMHMSETDHFRPPDDKEEWDQSQYFFPTYENDNLLSCLEECEEPSAKGDSPPVIVEDCSVKESILSEEEFRESLLPKSRRKKPPE